MVDEALRSGPVGGQQDFGTPVAGLLGEPVLHRRRSHQADARVAMLVVVPVEECPAEEMGVFDRLEASRELGSVLERPEVGLGVGIVRRGVGPRVCLGDPEIGEQEGDLT